MKNTFWSLGLFAAAAVFAAGCKTDHGAYAPVNNNNAELENSAPFVLLGPRVQESVACSGISQRTLEDGRLDVTANVRNRENRRIQVQVNCVFKDALGTPTGDETPFENLILTENSQEGVHFVSMNDKAKRFTIRVREAH